MINFSLEDAKQKLGEQTQKLERKAGELWNEISPNYTNLEPWQRGLILIGILIILALALYYLTHENQNKKAQRKAQAEQALEDKIIKRMELLKKLRE
jgi:hypothetical protein